MKNVLVAVLVFCVVAILASCSTYTCPTYAKAPAATEEAADQEKENI